MKFAAEAQTASTRVWLTWERHRRSRELWDAFGAEIKGITSNFKGLFRYSSWIARTLIFLACRRPSVIFAQTRSIVLAALAVSWGQLTGAKVIVDAHNAGVAPAEGKFVVLQLIARTAARSAYLNIVTNSTLCAVVQNWGGTRSCVADFLFVK